MRLVRTAELETVRTTPRKLPERLPFPNKPEEPDWGKIGWEYFENLDVNKVIWERWAPPMRNRYLSLRYLEELGRKEFSYDVDQLGSMTDEELVRLDDEIKKMSYTLANKQADDSLFHFYLSFSAFAACCAFWQRNSALDVEAAGCL